MNENKEIELADNKPREYRVFGAVVSQDNLFRAIGLVGIILAMLIVTIMLKPVIASVFSEAGRQNLIAQINNAGPFGAFMLLGLEFIQVVVAVIPGEVVQMVAGMLYGPWLGAAIILIGCLLSTWAVYEMVHRLGQPFVEAMVPTKYLDSIRRFEQSGKLDATIFILFLIPGLPKDTFTYLVPLTSMPRNKYLVISVIARIPGVFMSTFAASGLMTGNIGQSIAVFAVLAVLGIAGILGKDKLMDALHRK